MAYKLFFKYFFVVFMAFSVSMTTNAQPNNPEPRTDVPQRQQPKQIDPNSPIRPAEVLSPQIRDFLNKRQSIRSYQTHGVVFFGKKPRAKTIRLETNIRDSLDFSTINRLRIKENRKLESLKIETLDPIKLNRRFDKRQLKLSQKISGKRDFKQPKGTNEILTDIAVPDITVEVREEDFKTVIATTKTDLNGHYRVPEVPEGTYTLCWKGPNWAEECFQNPINIKDHNFYSEIIYIQPEVISKDVQPLTGKVRMLDEQLCRHLDVRNGINQTAIVQLSNGTKAASVIRANSIGQYVFPSVPQNAGGHVSAKCDDESEDNIKTAIASHKFDFDSGSKLITGDIGLMAKSDAASGVSLTTQTRQDLKLSSTKPTIVRFGAVGSNGKYSAKALPGEVIQLSSEVIGNNQSKKFVRFWSVSGGTLATSGSDEVVEWTPPSKSGQYTASISVANGQGGWAAEKINLRVTEDPRLPFSGQVKNASGISSGAINPKVEVNGQSIAINQDGYFHGLIPPNQDGRYALSVEAVGYMPISHVYHRSSTGGVYNMESVSRQTFNAGTGGRVSFKIPDHKRKYELCRKLQRKDDRNCSDLDKEMNVSIAPGSLVDTNGNSFLGQVTARGALLNPSEFSLPGDYDGLARNGEDQSLISYGALYVNFTDVSGNQLQLGSGRSAEISIPIPSGHNLSAAPETIPLWYYDYDTGYWIEEGVGQLNGNTYRAVVSHFSTINMDVGTVGNAVCARVKVDFLNTPEDRILKVTTTLPGGGTQVKQKQLDDTLNAVYRLLPNETITFDVLRSDGSDYPEIIYKDEIGNVIVNGVVATSNADLMQGVDLWPEEPYADCIPFVLLTGEITPRFDFLTRKGANNVATVDHDNDGVFDQEGQLKTEAYYELMDPDDQRLTLQDWLIHNDFDPSPVGGGFSFAPGAQVVSLSYLNHGDLGSGRRMHCRKDSDRVACVVGNYAEDGDINNAFNRDPSAAEVAFNANMGEGFATVAMEFSNTENIGSMANYGYSDSKLVKFFTYVGPQGTTRALAAGLDRVSDPADRWHPNVCMVCHGGDMPFNYDVKDAAQQVISTEPMLLGKDEVEAAPAGHREALLAKFMDSPSTFREFDLVALRNLQGTNPENKAKQLNCNYVQEALPIGSEVQDLLDGWYGPNCTEQGSPTQNTYIPSSWNGNNSAYTEVAGKACRTCHVAQIGLEVIDESAYPWTTMTSSTSTTYACSSSGMPQAAVTFNAYWMENMDDLITGTYGSQVCPP